MLAAQIVGFLGKAFLGDDDQEPEKPAPAPPPPKQPLKQALRGQGMAIEFD
jgi:hypothetical protein